MSRAISEIFDVEPVVHPIVEKPKSNVALVENDTLDSDADIARKNLRELMETAHDALKEALNVAVNSESPRAYSVVAELLNASSELNSRLLDTHSVQNRIKQAQGKDQPINATQNNTTNNVVFNGTPAELAKLLKGTQ